MRKKKKIDDKDSKLLKSELEKAKNELENFKNEMIQEVDSYLGEEITGVRIHVKSDKSSKSGKNSRCPLL